MQFSRKLILPFIAALAGTAMLSSHVSPVLLYNPSPSIPAGFYWRASGTPRVGDLVFVPSVNAAPDYARQRDFVDRTDRFIKRIAATSGQVVCAKGDHVSVEDARVVRRLAYDKMGRALPTWSGCRRLADGEVFLLGDTADSFDGRYWGSTPLRVVDGPWRPLRP